MYLNHFALTLTAVVTLLSPLVTANCYVGNGTDRNIGESPSNRYSACNTDSSGASMCCSRQYGGDSCQALDPSNPAAALCWNQGSNVLWRESCTDRSWSSINCVKLFLNGTGNVTDIPVTNCSASGLGPGFCYGNLNLGCCRAGQAVFIDPATGEQVATNPDATTSTTSSTPTSTSSPATSTATAPSNQSSGLSTGAKAGIGVGVSLGVVALLVVGMVLYARRRGYLSRSKPTTRPTMAEPDYYKPPIHNSSVEAGSGPVSELKGQSRHSAMAELPAYSVPARSGASDGGAIELGN